MDDNINDKLFRRIEEAAYLTAENAWRYRAILRFFYLQHEKLRHYLFPEDIFRYLKQSPYFAEYTLEQLEQDLKQLVEWKNLVARQDMRRVTSIEEFRKKRFRYQCTPYTVEFERMIINLEEKGEAFEGSLETTLFDRLHYSLKRLLDENEVAALPNAELFALWEEFYDNFRKLTENATDYLAHLESEKVEGLMQTESFLAYKDSLTDYLRNFVHTLHRTSSGIEELLKTTSSNYISGIVERLTAYYLSIPRLEEQPPWDEVYRRFMNHWESAAGWFLGEDGRESDLNYLFKATDEAIRRITRYAQRLGERYHSLQSRYRDYLSLAEWFASCSSLEEAHRLYACVFGVSHTRHLYVEEEKSTEDIYTSIWQQEPARQLITPRLRQYRGKSKPQAVVSRQAEKEEALQEYRALREKEQKLMEQVTSGGRIKIRELEVSDPYVRKILLHWIGKASGTPSRQARTEMGHNYRLEQPGGERVTLQWDDGVLEMPPYEIVFLD